MVEIAAALPAVALPMRTVALAAAIAAALSIIVIAAALPQGVVAYWCCSRCCSGC
jgi:hypothetical protein